MINMMFIVIQASPNLLELQWFWKETIGNLLLVTISNHD